MALQDAFQFIQRVRSDGTLHDQLQALGDDVTLEQIISLAAMAGFNFDADDLQKAHKYDWALRWARYRAVNTTDSEPNSSDVII